MTTPKTAPIHRLAVIALGALLFTLSACTKAPLEMPQLAEMQKDFKSYLDLVNDKEEAGGEECDILLYLVNDKEEAGGEECDILLYLVNDEEEAGGEECDLVLEKAKKLFGEAISCLHNSDMPDINPKATEIYSKACDLLITSFPKNRMAYEILKTLWEEFTSRKLFYEQRNELINQAWYHLGNENRALFKHIDEMGAIKALNALHMLLVPEKAKKRWQEYIKAPIQWFYKKLEETYNGAKEQGSYFYTMLQWEGVREQLMASREQALQSPNDEKSLYIADIQKNLKKTIAKAESDEDKIRLERIIPLIIKELKRVEKENYNKYFKLILDEALEKVIAEDMQAMKN